MGSDGSQRRRARAGTRVLLLALALAACTRASTPAEDPPTGAHPPEPDGPVFPDPLDVFIEYRELRLLPQQPEPPEFEGCVGKAALAVASDGLGAVGDSVTLADVTGDGELDLVLGAYQSPSAYNPRGQMMVTSSSQRGVVVHQPDDWDQVWRSGWAGYTRIGCCAVTGELDGTPRLLVGAPGFARSPTPGDSGGVGRAYLLEPPLPMGEVHLEDVAIAMAEADGRDSLGFALEITGDLTGDGSANWVAGGPRWVNTSALEPGMLAIFDGAQTGSLHRTDDSVALLRGRLPDDEFGRSAHAVDQNGDGVPELVVSAIKTHHPDTDTYGSVYWFQTPLVGEYTAEDAFAERTSVSIEAGLGLHLDSGDLDGDGYPEVVVAAHSDHSDGFRAGRVYLVHGPDPGSGPIDQGTSVIRGGGPAGSLGVRARVVGDLDGDGIDDLAVTIPKNPYFIHEPGELLLFLGPIQGTLEPDDAWLRWTSDCPGDRAGADLDFADVDGDGKLDFLLGAPWSTIAEDAKGGAYLLLGSALGLP